ncbi:MAG: hypothetical protein ACYSU3_16725 [Planctomycetota bacterium]
MKNKCLFPDIAFITRAMPMLGHPVQDTHKAGKQKLSGLNRLEDQTE